MQSSQSYEADTLTLEQLEAYDGTVLLEFGTPWCGYCIAARPFIQKALSKFADLPHLMVYDGKGKPLGRAFKVKRWPTLVLSTAGQERARLVRPQSVDQVLQFLMQAQNAE